MHTACDGLNALEILQNTKKPFDLLVTDIVMPGIDGIELAKRATRQNPDIKVIYITGLSGLAVSSQKEKENSDAKLLSKPFHLSQLLTHVEQALKTS